MSLLGNPPFPAATLPLIWESLGFFTDLSKHFVTSDHESSAVDDHVSENKMVAIDQLVTLRLTSLGFFVHMGLHVCRTETVEETNKVQKMYEKYHNIPVSSSPSGQLQLSYIDDNDDNTNCNPAIHPLREQNENNHNRNKSFEVVSTIETGDYAPDSQTEEAMLQWALALSTQNNTGEDEEISLALETNAKETQTRQKEPMRRPKNGKTLNDVAATTVDDCPDSIPQERCKTPVNTLTETQSLKTQRSSRYRTPSGKYVRREMKENPTLRSSKKRKGTPDGGNGKKKSRIKLNVSQEDEDEELKKVLQLSLKECQHEAKVEDDLEKALALSLQETTIDGTLNDASKMSNDHKLDCDVPHLPCAGVAASQVYVNHQKLRHLSTTQSPKHSDQKTSTDQNTANSSGHTDNNTANLSGHSDHNTANSSRHSDQSTANLSGHSDHNTANSSRHSDQSTANSSGHFGHNTANLSGHSDQNTANSSGHSDHNTANLSGHSDQSTANSSRHSDNNTANSSRHSDHNTANLSGHSDQSTANLFGHSDQSTANSSRHFDNNPANSSRHSDHNTANSSGHSDQNAAKPLLENTAKEIDEDNADTLIYDDTMQEDMMDVDTQEEEPETESGILAAKLLIENAVIATDEDTLIYDDTMQKHVIDVDTNEEEPETESGTLAAKPVIENAVIAIDENYIANTHIYDDTMQEDMMDIDTQEEEPETELGSYTAKEDSITGKECKHKHDINMKTLTDKVKLETAFIGDVDLTRDSQNDSQEQSDSQESLYILEDDQPVKVHSSKAGRKEDVKLNKSLSYSIDLTESDEHLICLPKVNLITNVNVVNPTRRPARKSPKKRKHPNGNTQTVGDDGGPELALALKLSMNDLHKQSDEEYARKLQKQFDNDVKESMGTNTVVNVIEKSDANVPWQELIDVAARDNAVNVPRTPTHFKSNVESTCTSKAQEDTDFEVAVKYHCDINGRDSYSITPMSSNALTGKPPSKSKVASMRIQNQIEEYRRLQREKNSMTPIGKNSQTHSAPSHSAGSSYSSRIPSSTPSRPSAFVTPTANITPLSSLKPSANARSISSDDDDDDYLPDVGHLLSPTASTPKLSTSHLTPNKSPATVNHSQTSSVYSSGIAQSPSAITGSQDRLSNTTCGNCKGKGHTRVSKHCPAYFSESEVTRRQERADKLRQTKEEKERKLEQLHTQLTENAEQYEQAQRTMIRHFGNTRQIIEQLSKLKKRRRKK
uniref:Dentin sialophosphoprotein-like n=1 Tax=Saccoglossus kowalevskii TaxID=10224 RepID=A0ABM0MFW5_SACKO|nr:PREDICTED: dentin sialophosphoprotein-like [Saccoglossus kowalevskii]